MLILALSGRALAQAAARAGFQVEVLDCFADTDTVACARRVHRAEGDGHAFNMRALQRRIAFLAQRYGDREVVVGSGFEHCPGALREITAGWRVYANPVTVIQELKDWRRFFSLLDRLNIPHPAVTAVLPGTGWLRKSGAGAGGRQVCRAEISGQSLASGEYYQRWQPGRVLSAVFLGDGREARIVGYSEQAQVRIGACPWVYAGAVSLPSVTRDWAGTIADWAGRLTAATGLRGLCGLDFILDPQGWPWLLEVNPRPPASFELHDTSETILFAAHIRACEGQLPRLRPRTGPCLAQAVLYATQAVTIPADFHWPEWASDLPAGGTTIRQGQPICSVRAQGDEPGQAMAAALQRRQQMESGLHAQQS